MPFSNIYWNKDLTTTTAPYQLSEQFSNYNVRYEIVSGNPIIKGEPFTLHIDIHSQAPKVNIEILRKSFVVSYNQDSLNALTSIKKDLNYNVRYEAQNAPKALKALKALTEAKNYIRGVAVESSYILKALEKVEASYILKAIRSARKYKSATAVERRYYSKLAIGFIRLQLQTTVEARIILKAGRMISLLSRSNLITLTIRAIVDAARKRVGLGTQDIIRKQMVKTYKKIAKHQLHNLRNIMGRSLSDMGNRVTLTVDIDTSDFNSALKDYMKYTRKDIVEVVNQKAFYIAKGAVFETHKSTKEEIKAELEAPSKNMPGLTVAQAMIVGRLASTGQTKLKRNVLNTEAKKLVSRRNSSIGYLRSGWIPAVNKLSTIVKAKVSVGMTRLQHGKDLGGASAATENSNSNTAIASVWNSVTAHNSPLAAKHLMAGLQRSLDKETASMLQYVEKKLQKNADRFNRR